MSLTRPKRLFHVPSMSTVMYRDVADDVEEKGYVAVSHIWGEQTLYTPESLGVEGGIDWEIPLSNIRKMDMLKSAMEHFKMEWCWFDVLCMPQGEHNQGEVNREIPYMGDYYNGAKVTLVLAEGKGPESAAEGLLVKGFLKGLTTITKHTTVLGQLGLWSLDEEPWIGRLWTFQEAVMSGQIWMVNPYKNYLDMSDAMRRLIASGENSAFCSPDDPTMNLARAIRDYGEYKTSVGRMLHEGHKRKCYKPQDRYYGMLGILGYVNFPVTYDITMEDLGKKLMEHAYSNMDVSWLAVHTKDKTGFIPSCEDVTYIGELWREEEPGMCDIKFEENTLWINACVVADVTHSHKVVDNKIDLEDMYKEWGVDDSDVIRAFTGHCWLSDGEIKNLKSYYDADATSFATFRGLLTAAGIPGGGSIGKLFKKHMRHGDIKWQTVCKVVCTKTEKNVLMTFCGECDVGDKIMLLPMHDIHGRTLGIAVDDTLRRKGICLYPKLDLSYEYMPYEFPL